MKRIAVIAGACVLAIAALADWRGAFDDAYFSQGITTNAPLIAGLVAHWKMNDNAGNTNIVDSKGTYTGYALHNSSTLTVAGKINTAITNTANDYIFCPGSTNLSFDYYDSFSVSMWIKCPTISGTRQFIAKNVSGGDSGFEMFNEGATVFVVSPGGWEDGCYEYFDQTEMQNMDDGNWHHLVAVYGGVYTDITMYLDNVAYSPTRDYSNTPSGSCNNAQPIRLFGNTGGFRCLTGVEDDVRIYNRKLTADEVAILWNSGNGTEDE